MRNDRMKKVLVVNVVVNVVVILVVIIIVILFVIALYNHIRLSLEFSKTKNIGTLVDVAGYKTNVYTEGEKHNKNDATIVLLSGSGVASPIYDYKVLYSKLSGDYRVAVIEKFGYGYAEVSGISRDVTTMVAEDRRALAEAGESAPYVLMPHSMSALEAIYWAYTYPNEIAAIIGLDMAVPNSYDVNNNNIANITLMKIGCFFGLHRFEIFNPVSNLGLTNEEYEQNKLLNYRNALNKDVYKECKMVFDNAETVRDMDISNVPVLMFTTNLNDEKISGTWVKVQDDFATKLDYCIQIKYKCGHYLYYYKADEMSEKILDFLNNLNN
jgi:pimeloyl-ACP methyl ester carboxylesterase